MWREERGDRFTEEKGWGGGRAEKPEREVREWERRGERERVQRGQRRKERGRHEVSRGSPDTDLEHKEGNLL